MDLNPTTCTPPKLCFRSEWHKEDRQTKRFHGRSGLVAEWYLASEEMHANLRVFMTYIWDGCRALWSCWLCTECTIPTRET